MVLLRAAFGVVSLTLLTFVLVAEKSSFRLVFRECQAATEKKTEFL